MGCDDHELCGTCPWQQRRFVHQDLPADEPMVADRLRSFKVFNQRDFFALPSWQQVQVCSHCWDFQAEDKVGLHPSGFPAQLCNSFNGSEVPLEIVCL